MSDRSREIAELLSEAAARGREFFGLDAFRTDSMRVASSVPLCARAACRRPAISVRPGKTRRWCSRRCHGLDQRARGVRTCVVCWEDFKIRKTKRATPPQSIRKTCSAKCAYKISGQKNHARPLRQCKHGHQRVWRGKRAQCTECRRLWKRKADAAKRAGRAVA